MTMILNQELFFLVIIFSCLPAFIQSLKRAVNPDCLRFVQFPIFKWTLLFCNVLCALDETVWRHRWGLSNDWWLIFWVYILEVLRSVKVNPLMERSVIELNGLHFIGLSKVYLFYDILWSWLLLVGYMSNFHFDMVRKMSFVMGLTFGREAVGSLAVCEWDSFWIVKGLVERRIFGDEGQFVGLDRDLFREVGAVSGVSDFLDGFILINVILVWNGKILAKRDH